MVQVDQLLKLIDKKFPMPRNNGEITECGADSWGLKIPGNSSGLFRVPQFVLSLGNA